MGYIGTKPGNQIATTAQIADGAVVTQDIASGAVTQAKLATGVAGTGPAFSAYQSSSQSVTSGVYTKIQCNTKEFDTNSNYDNVTNYRFTPTVAGYYQVNAQLDTSASAAVTYGIISIFKNGASFKQGSLITGTTTPKLVLSTLVYLNGSTDYIELYGFISGTTPGFAASSGAVGYFQAFLARSA